MLTSPPIGSIKTYSKLVTTADTATFDTGQVHPVYATFAIARDAEWAGRLFVLDMLEPGEEGIGTSIEVQHLAPALVGDTVIYEAAMAAVNENYIRVSFTAQVNERLIARGSTGQKILLKEKMQKIFDALR